MGWMQRACLWRWQVCCRLLESLTCRCRCLVLLLCARVFREHLRRHAVLDHWLPSVLVVKEALKDAPEGLLDSCVLFLLLWREVKEKTNASR